MCDQKAIPEILYDTEEELLYQIKAKKYCNHLNEKKLHLVTHYLIHQHKLQKSQKINVPTDAKCPVCGMFTAKYPKWASSLKTDTGKVYYFDGVKDLMKYYFDPKRFHHKKEGYQEILVSDYYTFKPIIAQKAWYVIGSNIYGPMGNELIPFETQADAKAFLNDHSGKKIISFDKITESLVYSLDH